MGSVSRPGGLGAALRMLVGVALELDLHTLGQEAPAALLATTSENVQAIFRLHALTIPELLFAGALGRLIGSFGHMTEDSGVGPGGPETGPKHGGGQIREKFYFVKSHLRHGNRFHLNHHARLRP